MGILVLIYLQQTQTLQSNLTTEHYMEHRFNILLSQLI